MAEADPFGLDGLVTAGGRATGPGADVGDENPAELETESASRLTSAWTNGGADVASGSGEGVPRVVISGDAVVFRGDSDDDGLADDAMGMGAAFGGFDTCDGEGNSGEGWGGVSTLACVRLPAPNGVQRKRRGAITTGSTGDTEALC